MRPVSAAVEKLATTHQEFSWGYAADMDFSPGEYQGQAFDASITSLEYNHLAAVPSARGGPSLRIVDERTVSQNGDREVKKIMLDGLQVDLSDASAVETAITKLQGQLKDATDAKVAAETKVATLTTDAATKDAEIVTLKKQVEDSKITPAQMRDAAKAYALTVGKAKQLGVTVSDEMDETAIMKAVVSVKIGDAAKDWNDTQIAASFSTLTAGLNDEQSDPIRDAFKGGIVSIGDAEKEITDARAAMIADMKAPGQKAA